MVSVAGRGLGISVSAYVVGRTMIDAGFWHARDALAAAVDRLGVRGAVLTHWHEDHAGNAPRLVARGLPLSAREDTLGRLQQGDPVRAYRRLTWGQPPAL